MNLLALIACIHFIAVVTNAEAIDIQHLQCLICKRTMTELKNEMSKIDPTQNMETGGYRLDAEGNDIRKKVRMVRSAVHISTVLDDICEKMSNYVRATYKSNGKLTLLSLMSPDGGMNPMMSKVDIIQDGDLNKSLTYLCEEIVGEHEESIIERLQNSESDDIVNDVCTTTTEICNNSMPSDDEDEPMEEEEDDDYAEKTEL